MLLAELWFNMGLVTSMMRRALWRPVRLAATVLAVLLGPQLALAEGTVISSLRDVYPIAAAKIRFWADNHLQIKVNGGSLQVIPAPAEDEMGPSFRLNQPAEEAIAGKKMSLALMVGEENEGQYQVQFCWLPYTAETAIKTPCGKTPPEAAAAEITLLIPQLSALEPGSAVEYDHPLLGYRYSAPIKKTGQVKELMLSAPEGRVTIGDFSDTAVSIQAAIIDARNIQLVDAQVTQALLLQDVELRGRGPSDCASPANSPPTVSGSIAFAELRGVSFSYCPRLRLTPLLRMARTPLFLIGTPPEELLLQPVASPQAAGFIVLLPAPEQTQRSWLGEKLFWLSLEPFPGRKAVTDFASTLRRIVYAAHAQPFRYRRMSPEALQGNSRLLRQLLFAQSEAERLSAIIALLEQQDLAQRATRFELPIAEAVREVQDLVEIKITAKASEAVDCGGVLTPAGAEKERGDLARSAHEPSPAAQPMSFRWRPYFKGGKTSFSAAWQRYYQGSHHRPPPFRFGVDAQGNLTLDTDDLLHTLHQLVALEIRTCRAESDTFEMLNELRRMATLEMGPPAISFYLTVTKTKRSYIYKLRLQETAGEGPRVAYELTDILDRQTGLVQTRIASAEISPAVLSFLTQTLETTAGRPQLASARGSLFQIGSQGMWLALDDRNGKNVQLTYQPGEWLQQQLAQYTGALTFHARQLHLADDFCARLQTQDVKKAPRLRPQPGDVAAQDVQCRLNHLSAPRGSGTPPQRRNEVR